MSEALKRGITGIIIVAAFAAAACSASGSAQQNSDTPEKIGEDGARAWASFECAAIGSFAEDADKMERHFLAGHERGMEFVKALQAARKDQRERITNKVPVIMLWRLQGPSPDFMLGRVWEATTEYVGDELEDPKAAGNEPIDKVLRKARAEQHYRDRNCQLLDT